MKVVNFFFKTIYGLILFIITLAAIVVLGFVLWSQVKSWIYSQFFIGNDLPQFIHYVYYHFKHPGFPVNSWDYFWHNGTPRVLDATWLNFILIRPLVNALGFFMAIKIYPILSFGLFALFTFLIYLELSKSRILALGMAISLLIGGTLYQTLFSAGVVLSAISQAFFPMTLYFLARFYNRGTYRNLCLAGIAAALGFYSHGLVMTFFGFIPSFIFLLLATKEGESIINKKSIKNAFIFAVIALSVGALGFWPQTAQLLQGGSNSTLFGKFEVRNDTFQLLYEWTDWGIPFAAIIGLLVAMLASQRKELLRKALPFVVILGYMIFWLKSYDLGWNSTAGVLFPGRFFWFYPLVLGAIAALLLSPLSEFKPNEKWYRTIFKCSLSGVVKIIVFLLVISSLLVTLKYEKGLKSMIARESWNIEDPVEYSQKRFGYLLPKIDQKNINVRMWSHVSELNLLWNRISDIPVTGGYFHFFTKRSRLWEGWFYGVLCQPNWETQQIPRDMSKEQAKFFLDWYGIKYMFFAPGTGEWDLAPHFYQKSDYIEKAEVEKNYGFLEVSPKYTSGIVSAVDAPVVGFVGSDDGYMNFAKDIAMLDLDTSRMIPVRLASSVNALSDKKLKSVDALVIYDSKNRGLFIGRKWKKIANFVKNGGKVLIDTGGNSTERESNSLPQVFPIKSAKYGGLTNSWAVSGKIAEQVDFSKLEPLNYRGDPWNLSYAPYAGVKEGAKVLLTQKGNPVVVAQDVGKGRVVWSGLNSFYRPEEFRPKNGMNEVKVVEALIKSLLGEMSAKRVQAKVTKASPENITVEGDGKDISGVAIRENYWPGWNVKVEANGVVKNLSIYPAGPEMMFAKIPEDVRGGEIKVKIQYKGDPFHWAMFYVSIISLVFVIVCMIYLPLPTILGNKLKNFIAKNRFSTKIFGWWATEEDEE